MEPKLNDEEFVFTCIDGATYGDRAELTPIAMFMEEEAMTLVIPRSKADAYRIAYESVFKCISLTIHSSLDAIGLTAAFLTKLAEHGISANVIAGYFHDHIFIQSESAEKAIAALCDFGR